MADNNAISQQLLDQLLNQNASSMPDPNQLNIPLPKVSDSAEMQAANQDAPIPKPAPVVPNAPSALAKNPNPDDYPAPDGGMSSSDIAPANPLAQAPMPPSANNPASLLAAMDQVYGKNYSDKALQSAISNRNDIQSNSLMAKAGARIGAAIAGVKPDLDEYDEMAKNAGQSVQDVLTGRKSQLEKIESGVKLQDLYDKQALQDPNSDVSKAYRSMLLKYNPDAAKMPNFDKLTAEGVKQLQPMIDTALKRDMINLQKQQLQSVKEEQEKDKLIGKMTDAFKKPFEARSGAIGQAAQSIRKAEALQALMDNGGNLNSLAPQQVYEIARGVDSMISGGAPTAGATQHLLPSNVNMNTANIISWITSDPKGANQQKFLKMMSDTAAREKATADVQIKRHLLQQVPAFSKLKDDPRYQAILDNYGLTDLVKNNVKPQDVTPEMLAPKGQAAAQAVGDKVKVQLPDGRVGFVPKDNADAAVKQGAKIIQ